jgi:outer membrane protein assembly factor BamB
MRRQDRGSWRARRGLAVLATGLLAGAASACGTPAPPPPAGCAPGSPPVPLPAGSPWAGKLCRQANQTPPAGTNGVVYRDGLLWIASLYGLELVVADADTGELVGRFGPAQGMTTSPDDLVMADDGTVYWTGFENGDIGALSPETGRSRTLANVGAGANPIARAPDGSIWVGHAYTGTGLVRIDPATGTATTVNAGIAVNSFGFGPDGALYAPRTDRIPGTVARIDASGRATTVATGLGLSTFALKFPPPARGEDPATAYVLSGIPTTLHRINVMTGRKVRADELLDQNADNLTFAPDGTLFITTNTTPTVYAYGLDGRRRTIAIGGR